MFRFTIREVLWLTVVVGLALGWATSFRRMAAENRKLLLSDFDARNDLEYMEYWLLRSGNPDIDAFNHLKQWAIERRQIIDGTHPDFARQHTTP